MFEKKGRESFSFWTLCPYTHLFQVIKTLIRERRLPPSARQGVFIFLLGLFCPLFWIAYFSGAPCSELVFHAIHSGIFMVIGLVLILVAVVKIDKCG